MFFFICERVLSFRLKYLLHLKFSASFDELEFQFDLDIPKSTLCCICTFGECGCTRNSQNIIQFRERFRSLIQLQIQISSSSISQIILNASLNSNTLHSFTNKTDIFAFFPMGKCSDSLFLKPKCRNFLQIKSFAVNQIPTDMSATNVVFEWKPSITAFFWWF